MTKKCTKCYLEKEISEFWFSRPNVRRGECKACKLKYDTTYKLNNQNKIAERKERNKDATREYHVKYRQINKEKRNLYLREWNKKNPEKKRNQKYRHLYGIDIQDYNDMFKQQQNCCAICGNYPLTS